MHVEKKKQQRKNDTSTARVNSENCVVENSENSEDKQTTREGQNLIRFS